MPDSSSDVADPQEHESDFSQAWCRILLTSPSHHRVPFTSRLASPDPRENAFLRLTLSTPTTLRACIELYAPPTATTAGETLVLFSLGAALAGHPGVLHGGVVSMLLDEALGSAVERAVGAREIFTASLTVQYRRKVLIPGVVLARARIRKRQGRKAWTQGTLEDGAGLVFAEAEGLFLRARGRDEARV